MNLYSLASLSSVIRLLKTNLRCMKICNIKIDDILTERELAIFNEMRMRYNSEFVCQLHAIVNQKFESKIKANDEMSEQNAQNQDSEDNTEVVFQYVNIIADQIRDLEQDLNKLYHSSNLSSHM